MRANRRIIKAAAKEYDIPDWVLAGVSWTEVGGDPELTDELGVLFGLRPDRVSFGPVQMEIRRAAEELGYDLEQLSAIQRRIIIWSLLDPQQNLYLVASHLQRLKNIDSPGKAAEDLTEEDIRILGARFNRDPELTREQILTTGLRTQYGDAVVERRERSERLLAE